MCVSGSGSEILGRVGTHICFKIFFTRKTHSFMHFERQNYIFTVNLKKNLGFTRKFRLDPVTLNSCIFFIWPYLKLLLVHEPAWEDLWKYLSTIK